MRTITIGVDLAKYVFSVCEMDGTGRVLRWRDINRDTFCGVAGAGAGGHRGGDGGEQRGAPLGRRCLEYGLQPRLMAAQFLTPFHKNRTAKNDRNDTEASATAARQGNMRFVSVKTVDQQAWLSCHRVREGYKKLSYRIVAARAAAILSPLPAKLTPRKRPFAKGRNESTRAVHSTRRRASHAPA